MYYWLLEKGFTEEQIIKYAKDTNCKLEDIKNNSNSQIDSLIKHQILLKIYKNR